VLDYYIKKRILQEFSGETSKEIYPKVKAALSGLHQ